MKLKVKFQLNQLFLGSDYVSFGSIQQTGIWFACFLRAEAIPRVEATQTGGGVAETPVSPAVIPETQPKVQPLLAVKTQPIATPCRAAASETSDHGLGHVPFVGDKGAASPESGTLLISENAINLRLRRVFLPNPRTGEYRVADNIRKMYQDKKGKGRDKILKVFQSCGFDGEMVDVKTGGTGDQCCGVLRETKHSNN